MTEISNTSKLVAAAILFGDMKGSATLAEEDESSTIERLREYRAFTRQTVEGSGASFCKVKFEGDGFMAVFETPHEMVACGFKLQQEFRRRGWLIRLGGSFGAVYRDEGGDVDGADVNRAARIQHGADALTCEFLVSQAVEQIVRKRLKEVCFLPHDPLQARGIAEPLEVCAVAPAADGAKPRSPILPRPPDRSIRWQWIAGLAALTIIAGALARYVDLSRVIAPTSAPSQGVVEDDLPSPAGETVAVLEFENQRTEDSASGWYSKALQTNLSTGLNDIDQFDVIALARIKQHARRENLDVFDAAQQLHVQRLVMGSYAVYSDHIRIDVSVVDAQKGLQTAAWTVTGPTSAFFELQEGLREKMLDKFNIQLTEAQRAKLETASLERAKTSETVKRSRVDKYRLLLESEGVTSSPPQPDADADIKPEADVRRRRAWIDVGMSSVVAAALAQTGPVASREEVEQFLERYRVAYESGDIPRLASLYVSFPQSQLRSVEAYMSSIDDLHVALDDVDIQIGERDASVTYTRRDTFVDKETEEEISLEVRLTRFLVRQGEELKFGGGE